MYLMGILLELLHHHFYRIGYLLVVIKQNLLADNLRDEEACRLVRPLVFAEVGRRIRQQFLHPLHHIIHVELRLGRNGNHFRPGQERRPLLDGLHQLLLVRQVYLVDEQQDRHFHLRHLVDEVAMLVRRLHHIRHIEQHIRIRQSRRREVQHRLLQFVDGLQHARRVREDNLHVVRIIDAHNAVARRLRLEGRDGNAFAHQGIHQRGLAHVGISHDINKTCFVHIDTKSVYNWIKTKKRIES